MSNANPPAGGSPEGLAIYIVEDDPKVREWAARLLTNLGPPVQVFATGREFLSAVRSDTTGCVLLDLHLPDLSGLEVLDTLRASGSDLATVVLTGGGDVPTAVRALRAGAADFLQKPATAEAIRAAVVAGVAASREASQRTAGRRDAAARLARLDARQREVLRLSVEGLAVKVIAAQVGMGQRTAERLRAEALDALGVDTVLQAAAIWRSAEGR